MVFDWLMFQDYEADWRFATVVTSRDVNLGIRDWMRDSDFWSALSQSIVSVDE